MMEKRDGFHKKVKELFENRKLFAELVIDSSPENLMIEDVEVIIHESEWHNLIILRNEDLSIQEAFAALSKYLIARYNDWELEDMRTWDEFTDDERIELISNHWISGFYNRGKLCLEEMIPFNLISRYDLKYNFRDFREEICKLTDVIIIDNHTMDSMYFAMSDDKYLFFLYCFMH
ncbi:hypothetical protein [Sebaldella sp. S0638]|uniref:hypothetical protein n=1 Tax=Sebaldella sp. S0638 TaxID=2957809 RepID=UPI0020A0915C|nr:hypothetical protein [Sebaldella sp. S0638]MCP1225291.1 hypothetical protein [Sebaldella sp. S0638]